jgi:hypothetical protein
VFEIESYAWFVAEHPGIVARLYLESFPGMYGDFQTLRRSDHHLA